MYDLLKTVMMLLLLALLNLVPSSSMGQNEIRLIKLNESHAGSLMTVKQIDELIAQRGDKIGKGLCVFICLLAIECI